ncbi:MAG: AgmX/PglI C-terminal domain-containing protein, partial [Myxococcales bacterium]|nr:AgmX/PglI C-terminal domain-containing protein [Myxococcales bacterium]
VIAGSGKVSAADVTNDTFKGTPVGRCVEGKVRSFRFPAFRGDPMRINMPFAL